MMQNYLFGVFTIIIYLWYENCIQNQLYSANNLESSELFCFFNKLEFKYIETYNFEEKNIQT